MTAVSNMMPRKKRIMEGPSTFPRAKGTPRSLQILIIFCWHFRDVGDSGLESYPSSVIYGEHLRLLKSFQVSLLGY